MKPLQILIVEDHFVMRKFLENYLNKHHIVTCKANGIEAIKWLESGNRPNIIIADLGMPVMNGHDFIDYIKSTEFYSNIPIIVVSGSEEELNGIGDDYLLKPFNPKELSNKIEKISKVVLI